MLALFSIKLISIHHPLLLIKRIILIDYFEVKFLKLDYQFGTTDPLFKSIQALANLRSSSKFVTLIWMRLLCHQYF